MKNKQINNKILSSANFYKAFSLIELSIIIMIIGLTMSAFVSWVSPTVTSHSNKYKVTQVRTEKIVNSIIDFIITNQRLPCPAKINMNYGSIDSADSKLFNIENFDNNNQCESNIGTIPTAALALNSNEMLDGWGRKFTYITSPSLCDQSGCNQAKFKNNNANLIVQQLGNASLISDNAAFIVISHGPNGRGAYTKAGNQISGAINDELENINGDNIFRAGGLSDDFQHLLKYITGKDLNYLVYNPARTIIKLETCQNNTNLLDNFTRSQATDLRANYTATQIIGQHNDEFNNSVNVVTNYGDEAILEVIWALQEACALIYPGQITKSCPQNYVYNNNDNSCVRNNGIWEPLP